MNILAIDTCTEAASISLSISGQKTSRVILNHEKNSGHILKLCDEVFDEANIELNEIDAIVYTKGPGAFTGVRMCVGVVQGLNNIKCQWLQEQLIGVSPGPPKNKNI